MQNSWREQLKSGPLNRLYGLVRNTKRRLRGEPAMGNVPVVYSPLTRTELLALPESLPDHARVYYSLALAWLETESDADLSRAMACLRCAETLGFEADDRALLVRAAIARRCGDNGFVAAETARLQSFVLNPAEMDLRDRIIRGAFTQRDPACEPTEWKELLACQGAERILVIGDEGATSAFCLAQAEYLLAAPSVTGLSIERICGLRADFDVCILPPAERGVAMRAGVRSEKWLDLPSGRDGSNEQGKGGSGCV